MRRHRKELRSEVVSQKLVPKKNESKNSILTKQILRN